MIKPTQAIMRKLIFIFLIISAQASVSFCQQDNLEVKGKIQAQTLTLDGGATYPSTPLKGEVFYRNDENKYHVWDGATWAASGGGAGPDKYVVTRIVAASNSLDKDIKADYTCTGSNDEAKIQSAINDVSASAAGGGTVYLLEGTYSISGSINLASNIALIGTGRGTLLKLATSVSSVNVINASNANRILISNLMIDGYSKTGTNNYGISFNSVTYSKIDRVGVSNMKSAGIYFSSSSNNIISGSTIMYNGSNGIYLYRTSNNNIISGNQIKYNTLQGLLLDGSSSSYITSNNTISGNVIYAHYYDSYGCQNAINLSYANNNTISGNDIQSAWKCYSAIYLKNSSSKNIIYGNNLEALQTSSKYAVLLDTSSADNVISGNYIDAAFSKGGVYILSSSENLIYGNVIAVLFPTSGDDGIKIESSTNTIVSSNILRGWQTSGYPINIVNTGCTKTYITGNLITSWPILGSNPPAEGKIYDNGALNPNGTVYTDKLKITLQPAGAYTGLANGSTLTPTGVTSYLQLNPSSSITLGNPAISAGKSIGDLLVLENTNVSNTITLNDGSGVQLQSNLTLTRYDTLTLIWDGTYWIEIGFAANN